MRWTTPADVKARLRRQWERGDFLSNSIAPGDLYPLRLSIRGPNSSEITADFAAVQDWAENWRQQSDLLCEWKSVGHRLFGTNQIPSSVVFSDANAVVSSLRVDREWEMFHNITEITRSRFPVLLPWLAQRSMQALTLAPDWEFILSVVTWVQEHPHSGRYLRQVDLPGVHTKFIEGHRGVIAELLDLVLPPEAIDASARGTSGFNRRYGFREKSERIRFRFLDRACSIEPDRLGLDLTLDSHAFSQLNLPVRRVFITENEINFLAFPDYPRSLIIFGSGYGWSVLDGANWLRLCDIYYWGDIDTHGFAILDQLRSHLPHTKSLLMDSSTFESFRHFCSIEPTPARRELQRLNFEESLLYKKLCSHANGEIPRLEQERIPISKVEASLARLD